MIVATSRADEVMAMLAERWPACFSVYEARRRPLKIGIRLDLEAALVGENVTETLRADFYGRALQYRISQLARRRSA